MTGSPEGRVEEEPSRLQCRSEEVSNPFEEDWGVVHPMPALMA